MMEKWNIRMMDEPIIEVLFHHSSENQLGKAEPIYHS